LRGRRWELAILALILACSAPLRARAQIGVQAGALSIAPKQWATEAAQNELGVINYGHLYLRYREHTKDAKGDHIRDVIESKDGTVARMVMKEGRPLTSEEDSFEHDRLQAMLDSPGAFAKHVKGDATGKKLGADMMKLLPDAMIFTYTPGQPQRPGHTGVPDDIVLDYKPNPDWKPPSTASEALTGIEGRVWIDPQTQHLTRMDATVFRGINFGLFLAHIYPGGHLTFEQGAATGQRWIFTRFTEHVEVRVIFKAIREDTEIEASDFSPVPAMSYQEAIHTLLATPLPGH
jgi:hypothetical protein